jgi:hypothetical protein
MTPLSKRKSRLQFMTDDVVREKGKLRQVIVEAHPGYCSVRLSGLRSGFSISYGGIYAFAARRAAEQLLAAKKAAKKKGGVR